MGIFDFFKFNKQFLTENQYQKNLENQMKMVPETVAQLNELGINEETELKLEFFFYSNSSSNTTRLYNELSELEYFVEYWKGEKLYVITGWTTKMKISIEEIKNWTKRMCEIGFKHDCDFDGWGTSPDQ